MTMSFGDSNKKAKIIYGHIERNHYNTDEKVPANKHIAELRDGVIYMPSTPSMLANLRTNIFEILTSVAAIARRYNGSLTISTEGSTFSATVVLYAG